MISEENKIETEKVPSEDTKEEKVKDMLETKRLKKAFANEKKVTITIPKDPLNLKDEFVTASINGYTLQIRRGVAVAIPQSFYKVLKEAKYVY